MLRLKCTSACSSFDIPFNSGPICIGFKVDNLEKYENMLISYDFLAKSDLKVIEEQTSFLPFAHQ